MRGGTRWPALALIGGLARLQANSFSGREQPMRRDPKPLPTLGAQSLAGLLKGSGGTDIGMLDTRLSQAVADRPDLFQVLCQVRLLKRKSLRSPGLTPLFFWFFL